MTDTIATVLATIATAGIGACVRYLRRIDRAIERIERHTFTIDLHVLDLDQRVKRLEHT
jgi:hypothetical protein